MVPNKIPIAANIAVNAIYFELIDFNESPKATTSAHI